MLKLFLIAEKEKYFHSLCSYCSYKKTNQKEDIMKQTKEIISREIFRQILRVGGNDRESKLFIIFTFMTEDSMKEYAKMVSFIYKKGGLGIEINDQKYAVWFNAFGLRIAKGSGVYQNPMAVDFSWETVAKEIYSMLCEGEYATQSLYDSARDTVLRDCANRLINIYRDINIEKWKKSSFFPVEIDGTFPDMMQQVCSLLHDTESIRFILNSVKRLKANFLEDRNVMRFRRIRQINYLIKMLDKLTKEYRSFTDKKNVLPAYTLFITEDEINVYLIQKFSTNGRLDIYSWFSQSKPMNDMCVLIKSKFGIGGSTHSLSGGNISHAEYNEKGLSLCKKYNKNVNISVTLTWKNVINRIKKMIDQGVFLNEKDREQMKDFEENSIAQNIHSFFYNISTNCKDFFQYTFFYEDCKEDILRLLKKENQEKLKKLVDLMENVLLIIPRDSFRYKEKEKKLSIVKRYVHGEFTLFPKDIIKKEDECKQLTIFDLTS